MPLFHLLKVFCYFTCRITITVEYLNVHGNSINTLDAIVSPQNYNLNGVIESDSDFLKIVILVLYTNLTRRELNVIL